MPSRKLIVTGDDFGLSVPVNEAITKAHQNGILTTASLMVTGPAADDAVERARLLPGLKVGLHLVVISGIPCLSPSSIPDLVNAQNELSSDPVSTGIRIFFLPGTRKQLAAEIRAQFEAFKKTGLSLDHVNAHKHYHLHPVVLDLMIEIGLEYGLKAVRIPYEPPLKSLTNSGKGEKIRRYFLWWALKPFIFRMKKQLHKHQIKHNDFIYGMYDSGHMTLETLVRILSHLPNGLSEIYLHPATGSHTNTDPEADHYEFEAEYKALIHPRARRTLDKFSIELSGFGDAV